MTSSVGPECREPDQNDDDPTRPDPTRPDSTRLGKQGTDRRPGVGLGVHYALMDDAERAQANDATCLSAAGLV